MRGSARGPLARLLPRLLLALASTLVALAAAEVLLRRFAPAQTVVYETDAAALYRLRPGTRVRYHHPWLRADEEVEVAINSRGLRGPEIAPRKAGARIVVYGDSFIEARTTRLEETFPARLEAALRGRRPGPLEVVNAGVTGYGPDQVLARLPAELPVLQPDLLVLGLYAGNDWGDLVRDQIFRLDSTGGLVPGGPVLDESFRIAFAPRTGLRALSVVRAAGRLRAELRAAPPPDDMGSVDAALRECRREHAEAARHPGRVTNLFRDHYDADVSALPRSESARHKRRLMAGVLAALARLAAERSVPLLVLVIPAANDVSDAYPPQVDPGRFPEYRRAALTDGIEEIAAEVQIPVVNLFGPFRDRSGALYHPGDGHWNSAGQALAAERVAERILSLGLLP